MPADPSAPDYSVQTLAKVQELVPDDFNGQPVRFLSLYFGSVTYEEAFPLADQPAELLPYVAFQLWGRPLSRPTADPTNASRIYQRFENGVMMFDSSSGSTVSLPMGSYLKAILTGQSLPADLATAAQGSRFINQYQGPPPPAIARPNDLPDSNFADAFTPDPAPIDWSAAAATFAAAPMQAAQPRVRDQRLPLGLSRTPRSATSAGSTTWVSPGSASSSSGATSKVPTRACSTGPKPTASSAPRMPPASKSSRASTSRPSGRSRPRPRMGPPTISTTSPIS